MAAFLFVFKILQLAPLCQDICAIVLVEKNEIQSAFYGMDKGEMKR